MAGPIFHQDTAALPQGGRCGAFLFLLTFVAAMGGLLFGYDWVVIGGAAKFYEAYFGLKDTAAALAPGTGLLESLWRNAVSPVGWAQSCALVGCLAGALSAGFFCDRFGRKPVLVAVAANFLISSLAIAYADTVATFVVWRMIAGVGIGLASAVSPMYISEIAPADRRGLLVSVNQLAIVAGILAAQVVNWRIAEVVPAGLAEDAFRQTWNVTHGWRVSMVDAGRDTVIKAYDSLEAMGVVEAVHGKGFFVATQRTGRRIRTLVLFDTLFNGFKERVFDGMREKAGSVCTSISSVIIFKTRRSSGRCSTNRTGTNGWSSCLTKAGR